MRATPLLICTAGAALLLALPAHDTRGADEPRPPTVIKPSRIADREALRSLLPLPTAEESVLLEILENGRREVRALARQAAGLPDGPARRQLMRQASAIKLQTRLDVLKTRAQFARERGDLQTARDCEAAVEMLLHPRPRAATVSAAKKPVGKEGGPR
jgi:hypothetical protein